MVTSDYISVPGTVQVKASIGGLNTQISSFLPRALLIMLLDGWDIHALSDDGTMRKVQRIEPFNADDGVKNFLIQFE